MGLVAQATQALHEQLRRQEFQLSSNPRMLPREYVPQQVHVVCANTPTPPAKRGRGRGARGGGKRASAAGDRCGGKPSEPPGVGRGRGRGRGAAAGVGTCAPMTARNELEALCISPSPDASGRHGFTAPPEDVPARAPPLRPSGGCGGADAAGAGASGGDGADAAAAARRRWMPQVLFSMAPPSALFHGGLLCIRAHFIWV